MIHCQDYKSGAVPNAPNGVLLVFKLQDDLNPEFFVPKDILRVLVKVAFKVGVSPDDTTASFCSIVKAMKERMPNQKSYTVEMSVVPR